MPKRSFGDGILIIRDGSPTPVELKIDLSNGVLNLDPVLQKTIAYAPQGKLASLRKSSNLKSKGSFTYQIANYSKGTNQMFLDFINQNGLYASNVSSWTNSKGLYTVDLTLIFDNPEDPNHDSEIILERCQCLVDGGGLELYIYG